MQGYFFWSHNMWLFPMLGILAMVFCMFYLFKRLNPFIASNISYDDKSAIEILSKRYALGEICLEEYRAMRKEIMQKEG